MFSLQTFLNICILCTVPVRCPHCQCDQGANFLVSRQLAEMLFCSSTSFHSFAHPFLEHESAGGHGAEEMSVVIMQVWQVGDALPRGI